MTLPDRTLRAPRPFPGTLAFRNVRVNHPRVWGRSAGVHVRSDASHVRPIPQAGERARTIRGIRELLFIHSARPEASRVSRTGWRRERGFIGSPGRSPARTSFVSGGVFGSAKGRIDNSGLGAQDEQHHRSLFFKFVNGSRTLLAVTPHHLSRLITAEEN